MLLRQLLERRSGIGDRHEVRSLRDLRPEVREVRQRLGGRPRLAGDHEQRPSHVDGPLHREDLIRMGGVEDDQVERAVRDAERLPEHLGRQRRAPHPAEHRRLQPVVGAPSSERAKLVEVDLAHDVEPPQAVRDLGGVVAPHGMVETPDPGDDVVLGQDLDPVPDRPGQLPEILIPHRSAPLRPAPPGRPGTPGSGAIRAICEPGTRPRPWPGALPPRSSYPAR